MYRNKTKETAIDYFKDLRKSASNLLKMEKENLKNSQKYRKAQYEIYLLISRLDFKTLELLKKINKEEIACIQKFFGSDIDIRQIPHMEKDLTINYYIEDIIDERLKCKAEMNRISMSK